MTKTDQPTRHWYQYLWTDDGRWYGEEKQVTKMERDVRALFDEDNLRLLRRQTARRRLGFELAPYLAGPWSWLMRRLFG